MAKAGKQDTKASRIYPVRWTVEDWGRIVRAAEVLTKRDRVSRRTTAADVTRTGTLRFVDEVLAEPVAKAS